MPLAQRELQLDSQFVAEEKAVEAPNSFTDKTIKTEEFQQLKFFQELELHLEYGIFENATSDSVTESDQWVSK